MIVRGFVLLLSLAVAGLAAQTATNTNVMQTNPLLKESELAHQFPRFDLIRDEDVGPALKEGMVEELREIDAIAKNSDPPTFENTIVALERSGKLRKRVDRYFGNLVSAKGLVLRL